MTQKEVDRYAAELQRHGVESVEREVQWLSDLINAERNGTGTAAATASDRRLTHTADREERPMKGRARWVRFE